MPSKRSPRKGSLQFWPRKRALSENARVRHVNNVQDVKLASFAGYKVGMIQASYVESRKNKITKGMEIVIPVTIVECPPMRVYGLRLYKTDANKQIIASTDILSDNIDKTLKRTITLPKASKTKEKLDAINISEYSDVRLLVYTQPKLANFGKKKPELFESSIGGKLDAKWDYAKNSLGKEIYVSEILKDNQLVDIHAVTKGKGLQGSIRRFGLSLRNHKSEKTIRGPGSLGPWLERGKHSWTVGHPGQMGYHLRTEYNKLILKVLKSNESVDLNPSGGIHKYGIIKSDVILLKGSVAGPKKRLIKMIVGQRPNDKLMLPPNTNVNILKNY